jgi:hypothetical protein
MLKITIKKRKKIFKHSFASWGWHTDEEHLKAILVDSRIAINRVQLVTRKDYRPRTQPDNNNLLSIICELHHELRRPIKLQWIKSHQDTKLTYEQLSADAKLNVDVLDELATKFHTTSKAKPRRSTAHIPATRVSISINKVRYFGNLNANIRFHINGAYLRNYLQTNTNGPTSNGTKSTSHPLDAMSKSFHPSINPPKSNLCTIYSH